jgi:hypothetical protein
MRGRRNTRTAGHATSRKNPFGVTERALMCCEWGAEAHPCCIHVPRADGVAEADSRCLARRTPRLEVKAAAQQVSPGKSQRGANDIRSVVTTAAHRSAWRDRPRCPNVATGPLSTGSRVVVHLERNDACLPVERAESTSLRKSPPATNPQSSSRSQGAGPFGRRRVCGTIGRSARHLRSPVTPQAAGTACDVPSLQPRLHRSVLETSAWSHMHRADVARTCHSQGVRCRRASRVPGLDDAGCDPQSVVQRGCKCSDDNVFKACRDGVRSRVRGSESGGGGSKPARPRAPVEGFPKRRTSARRSAPLRSASSHRARRFEVGGGLRGVELTRHNGVARIQGTADLCNPSRIDEVPCRS